MFLWKQSSTLAQTRHLADQGRHQPGRLPNARGQSTSVASFEPFQRLARTYDVFGTNGPHRNSCEPGKGFRYVSIRKICLHKRLFLHLFSATSLYLCCWESQRRDEESCPLTQASAKACFFQQRLPQPAATPLRSFESQVGNVSWFIKVVLSAFSSIRYCACELLPSCFRVTKAVQSKRVCKIPCVK